ncbi:MAG: hypothetical protein JWP47_1252 [Polaromonas sp.]|jgi:hypothetical protein|nr:hypothetical protein [Polaromonas sp.]
MTARSHMDDVPLSRTSGLTPQERLAISRRAIVRHMHKNDAPEEHVRHNDDAGRAFGAEPHGLASGNWNLLKQAVRSWWHHHPAKIAVEVASPLLGKYAKANPGKLLGISAGIGAALVLLKPWRLISVGGILLAAIKSADISGAVMSMMKGSGGHSDDPHTNSRNSHS